MTTATKEKKITDAQKEAMRDAVFADSFSYSQKPRFGLFSQAPSTAVGESNYFKPKPPRRNEDGDVVTEPPGFKGGILTYGAKGRVGNPYAEYPTNAKGDPYKPAKVAGMRTLERQAYLKGGHEIEFTPAKAMTHKKGFHASSYENLPECTGLRNKKTFRTEDGEVIT